MPSGPNKMQSAVVPALLALGCLAALLIGGALTRPNLEWYDTLTKPSFTPPDYVFPIVWTVLYVAMAVAAWLVWRAPGKTQDKRRALISFGLQLVVGVLWSVAFFWLRNPGYGLAVIMVFLIAVVATIVLFDRLSRPAALLMVPLLLWVWFASSLNFSIWMVNG
jgi:translocator protein